MPSCSTTRRFQASAGEVGPARREVCAQAARDGVRDLHAVALAVSEAVTNVVLHARPEGAELAWVEVTTEIRPERGFVVTVADNGHGLRAREDSPGAGLGLVLITALTADLDLQTGPAGTRLTMTFPVAAPVPPATARLAGAPGMDALGPGG